MSSNKEIDAVQARLAKAQTDLEAWRTSGMQEKYLEAYTRVEALELELDRLRQQRLRSLASNDDFVVRPAIPAHAPGQWQRLMARLDRSRK